VTDLRIVIAGQSVDAHLADSPTARDLADQLPITLSFRDLNGVEKIAKLPRPLTTDGVPEGDDPDIADVGYYAPSQDLVLYYGDVGYWNGIVRIGRFDSTTCRSWKISPTASMSRLKSSDAQEEGTEMRRMILSWPLCSPPPCAGTVEARPVRRRRQRYADLARRDATCHTRSGRNVYRAGQCQGIVRSERRPPIQLGPGVIHPVRTHRLAHPSGRTDPWSSSREAAGCRNGVARNRTSGPAM
jgi:hypothetical protein